MPPNPPDETLLDRLRKMSQEEMRAASEEVFWGPIRRSAAEAINQERISRGWGRDMTAAKNADTASGIGDQELIKKAPIAIPSAKPEMVSLSPLDTMWQTVKPIIPSKSMVKAFPRKLIYGAMLSVSTTGITWALFNPKELLIILNRLQGFLQKTISILSHLFPFQLVDSNSKLW